MVEQRQMPLWDVRCREHLKQLLGFLWSLGGTDCTEVNWVRGCGSVEVSWWGEDAVMKCHMAGIAGGWMRSQKLHTPTWWDDHMWGPDTVGHPVDTMLGTDEGCEPDAPHPHTMLLCGVFKTSVPPRKEEDVKSATEWFIPKWVFWELTKLCCLQEKWSIGLRS